jgi:HTH-type transcriptional regulator/antitoxin HigA
LKIFYGKKKIDSLSPDFIIHPGETIKEALTDSETTQKELAIRADVSEKFVSQVISGKKDISKNFAKKLGAVFGTGTSFWINLQANFDKEITDYKNSQSADVDEEIVSKPDK